MTIDTCKLKGHLSENQLSDFLNDSLDASQQQAINEQLSECAQCRSTMEKVIGSTSILDFGPNTSDRPQGHTAAKSSSKSEQSGDDLPDLGFGNRFLILAELSRGGMGVVYRGFDREFQREVAIKIALASNHSSVAARFQLEAQITAQLQHPGVVPVHDLGQLPDGRAFIAMKLIEGETLLDLIQSDSASRAPASLLETFSSVCNTMAYAHDRNFIHRDLKPENIMVGAFGEVQIMDWGLAKKLPADSKAGPEPIELLEPESTPASGTPGQSQLGDVFGTPAYMPPEQAQGQHADKRSDVFALGGILYQILTGQPPFADASKTQTLAKSKSNDLVDAFQLLDRSNADRELVEIVKKCLATNPLDRPQDAGAVNKRISDCILQRDQNLEQARLENARSEERLEGQRRRNRQIFLSATAIVALLVVTAAMSIFYLVEKNNRITTQAKQEQEKLKQQSQYETDVQKSMALANQFRSLAKSQSAEIDMVNWDLAAQEMQNVAMLVDQLPTGELKTEFSQLNRLIKNEAAQASVASEQLVLERTCSEEISECCIASTIHPQIRKHLKNHVAILDRFQAAYQEIGVVVGDSSDSVVSRLAHSNYRDDFLFGLQTWEVEFFRQHQVEPPNGKATIRWIRNLIRKMDPDSFRAKVRVLIEKNDVQEITKLLQTEQAIASVATVRVCSMALPQLLTPKPAIAYLHRAQQRYPTDFLINHHLAGLSDEVSSPNEQLRAVAIQHTMVCYSLRPDHPNILLNLGATYISDGKPEMAIKVLEELSVIAPDFPMVYQNLANAYVSLKQYPEALEQCNKILELTDGKHAIGLGLRGDIHFLMGDTTAAIRDCKNALKLNPKLSQVHAKIAHVLKLEGRFEEALQYQTKAYELEPDYEQHRSTSIQITMHLYTKHRIAREYGKAREHLEAAIELQPGNLRLKEHLGSLFVSSNDLTLAEATFREILDTDRDNNYAVASLGNLFLISGDPERAEQFLRNALFDGVNSHTIQLELAKALLAKKDASEAERSEAIMILEKLTQLAPSMKAPAQILAGTNPY